MKDVDPSFHKDVTDGRTDGRTEGRTDGRKEGRMDGSVTISLRNFVGEGIISRQEVNDKLFFSLTVTVLTENHCPATSH